MNVKQDIVDRQFQTESFDLLLDDLVIEIEALNYSVTRISHIDNIYDRLEAGIDVRLKAKIGLRSMAYNLSRYALLAAV